MATKLRKPVKEVEVGKYYLINRTKENEAKHSVYMILLELVRITNVFPDGFSCVSLNRLKPNGFRRKTEDEDEIEAVDGQRPSRFAYSDIDVYKTTRRDIFLIKMVQKCFIGELVDNF